MSKMRKYWYKVDDQFFELLTHYNLVENKFDVAEEAANEYFWDHDGMEDTWPLIFSFHHEEDGPEICRLQVSMETQPCFSATETKE